MINKDELGALFSKHDAMVKEAQEIREDAMRLLAQYFTEQTYGKWIKLKVTPKSVLYARVLSKVQYIRTNQNDASYLPLLSECDEITVFDDGCLRYDRLLGLYWNLTLDEMLNPSIATMDEVLQSVTKSLSGINQNMIKDDYIFSKGAQGKNYLHYFHLGQTTETYIDASFRKDRTLAYLWIGVSKRLHNMALPSSITKEEFFLSFKRMSALLKNTVINKIDPQNNEQGTNQRTNQGARQPS